LISPALRNFAGLTKSVVLVGQGSKFELWDREKWEAALERSAGFGDADLPPELEGFSL
jgi:MraZ protein